MDAKAMLRAAGLNPATLTAKQFTQVSNALHAAYSEGHVKGYSAALVVDHRPHGL